METRLFVAYFLIGVLIAGIVFAVSHAAKRRSERRKQWAGWRNSRRRRRSESG